MTGQSDDNNKHEGSVFDVRELMSIPGPSVGYTDLIDHVMTEKIEKEAKENKFFPLRPSSAGQCTRRLTYELMEYKGHAVYEKEPMAPQQKRIFDLGYGVEMASLRALEAVKLFQVKYKQQSMTLFRLDDVDGKRQRLIEGSCDFVVMSDTWKGIGDVKSAKDKFSSYFGTKWDEYLDGYNHMDSLIPLSPTAWYADDLPAFLSELSDPFFIDNFVQLNAYCCTDWAKEHDIDHGFIYRYNKNDSRHLEIRFRPSMEIFNKTRDKFNIANKMSEAKTPNEAPRDYALGSIRCAFCPYKQQCWGEDSDGLKAFYATLPSKKWARILANAGPKGLEIESLLDNYEAEKKKETTHLSLTAELERKIIEGMLELKLFKIKMTNGHIYQLKHLKTPKERYVLRQSKN